MQFYASDILLKIHSDASYVNETKARSIAGRYFWLGNKEESPNKIKLNGPFHFLCSLIKLVYTSAAEAELAALFLNSQKGIKMKQALEDMACKQTLMLITINNSIAAAIANQPIKRQRLRSINMCYFWVIY